MTASPRGSYGQILKSTTLVGGSQVINILLGIVRTKFMAVLLGPEGIGLAGLYQAATGLVGTLTGLGVGSSGVRQIAEAAGTGDETAIARTIVTLRRIALILGVIGMLVTIVLCRPLSRATFGNGDQAPAIALLSLTLLFGSISGGQTALIQGLRRIRDLASLSVLGAFFGTLLGIPIIYLWGRNGIVPMLIAVSATGILTSWWYARKIPLRRVRIGWRETFAEGRGLLKLGLVFMASSLMTSPVMYLIRVIIVRDLGLDGAGLYQAANTLSNLDFHTGMMFVVIGYRSGFRWSRAVLSLPGLVAPCLVAGFLLPKLFAPRLAMALGAALSLILAGHSLHCLGILLGPDWRLSALAARLKSLCHPGKKT